MLEAFFLLAGMSDPRLAIAINQFRDLSLTTDSDFKYIFNKLDFTVPIKLEGFIDNTTRCATFMPLYEAKSQIKIREDKESDEIPPSLTRKNQAMDGLLISFRTSENPEETSTLSIKNDMVSVSSSYQEQLDCKYLHIKTRLDQMPKDISNIIIKKRMDTIVKVLGEIEPNLIIDHVQIEDMGGKDRFDAAIRAFSKMQGFDDIVNLGFVRDAENTPASAAFMSICGSLQHIDVQPPATIGKVEKIHDKKIGIFIMPNNNTPGMLETVCLNSIRQNRKYRYILPQKFRW